MKATAAWRDPGRNSPQASMGLNRRSMRAVRSFGVMGAGKLEKVAHDRSNEQPDRGAGEGGTQGEQASLRLLPQPQGHRPRALGAGGDEPGWRQDHPTEAPRRAAGARRPDAPRSAGGAARHERGPGSARRSFRGPGKAVPLALPRLAGFRPPARDVRPRQLSG